MHNVYLSFTIRLSDRKYSVASLRYDSAAETRYFRLEDYRLQTIRKAGRTASLSQ